MHSLRRIVQVTLLSAAMFLTGSLAFAADTPTGVPTTPPSAPPAAAPAPAMSKPAAAATDNGASERAPDGFDPVTNPVIASALQNGGKAYYLGNHSGLDGWLLLHENEVQIAYFTLDRRTVLLGSMYGAEGYDLSHDQIQTLIRTNREVASIMSTQYRPQNAGGGMVGRMPNIGGSSTDTSMANNTSPAMPLPVPSSGDNAKSTPANAADAKALMSQLDPPGERLLVDLQDASSVPVGDPKAPDVYMVMDPNCPHCKATWKMLRDSVLKNSIRVHLVPIGRNDEDERASAQLLQVADPLNAWNKYVDGDKAQLAGTPDRKLIEKVQANHVVTDRWSINETPYMLYRSKDGKIKVLAGEPKDSAQLLSDIGP